VAGGEKVVPHRAAAEDKDLAAGRSLEVGRHVGMR
jgi:hypothetical protein